MLVQATLWFMKFTERYIDFQQKHVTYCYYDFSVTVPFSVGLTQAQWEHGQHQQAHIMANFVCTVTETVQSPDMIASPAGGLGPGLLCFV